MDCLNAQTRITSYVEGELRGEELKEFLLHMRHCSGCREELEIYYTLMEATRQLDEGQLTTSDFMKELEDKMETELESIYAKESALKRWKAAFVILILCITTLATIKIMDIPIPFINPQKITWEQQRDHINTYMAPYMYKAPAQTERLE